jgi:hypothetical protein
LCWGGRERKEVDLHFTNDSSHSTTPSFACPFKKFSDSSQDSETPTTFPTLFSVPVTWKWLWGGTLSLFFFPLSPSTPLLFFSYNTKRPTARSWPGSRSIKRSLSTHTHTRTKWLFFSTLPPRHTQLLTFYFLFL